MVFPQIQVARCLSPTKVGMDRIMTLRGSHVHDMGYLRDPPPAVASSDRVVEVLVILQKHILPLTEMARPRQPLRCRLHIRRIRHRC